MSAGTPSPRSDVRAPQALDRRFVQWLALQTLHDRHARLVEGGAEADAQKIDLASIFIDLPVHATRHGHRERPEASGAMSYLLGMTPWNDARFSKPSSHYDIVPRFLLLGGPGSGKSTLTTMVAHILRLGWVNRQIDELPPDLVEEWQTASAALEKLVETSQWSFPDEPLPLRMHLPLIARWLATPREKESKTLPHYLAYEIKKQLGDEGIAYDLTAEEVQGWLDALPSIYWILDGLDEVPASAGRQDVINLVRTGTRIASRPGDRLLVATRPQGYAREFTELDVIELRPLPPETARAYAEKLVPVWAGKTRASLLEKRLQWLRDELAKPAVATLLQTPLHTTMAALLVANQGKLPSSRSELFEDYFQTILRRELNKPYDFGIRREDTGVLRALHTHAGLTLQVRSQQGAGARSTLRRRELREMLSAWYRRQGHSSESTIQANVDRIMGFAVERLVLLLHWSEGEFEFGVRSLQEFFAAEALAEDDGAVVEKRLADIATNPHWTNVLRLVASHGSRETEKRAIHLSQALVATCRAMNDGKIGGEPAKQCFVGSELAFVFLDETQEYGQPVLHNPLWSVALEGACSELARELGKLAANWLGSNGGHYRTTVLTRVEQQFESSGDARLDGWQLLYGMLCTKHPEAVALAERYQPTTKEEADLVVNVLIESDVVVPAWLAQFVDGRMEWFIPDGRWKRCKGEVLPLVAEYFRLLSVQAAPKESMIFLELSDAPIGWIIWALPSTSDWVEMTRRLKGAPPIWLPWLRLAAFLNAPSHLALADLLEAINSESIFERFANLRSHLPWPIVACLYHAEDHQALVAIAPRARAGELGTIDDWRVAQVRWRSSPNLLFDDMVEALVGSLPWPKEIGESGAVFASPNFSRGLMQDRGLAWVARLMGMKITQPKSFFRFLPIIAHLGQGTDDETVFVLTHLLEQNPRQPYNLADFSDRLFKSPDLVGPNAEQWLSILDTHGRTGKKPQWYSDRYPDNLRSNITALIERIHHRPDQWGLLDALFALVVGLPNTDLSTLKLHHLESNAPPRAHALHALFTLLASEGNAESRAACLAKLVFDENGTIVDFRGQLAGMLTRRTIPPQITHTLLVDAMDAAPLPRNKIRDQLRLALEAHLLRANLPAFLTGESWKHHEFPEPCLSEPCALPPPSRLVRISELRNIRLFKETPIVDEPFPIPATDQGQWIILVGENGVGKTTLIRALALTLTSPTIATELLDERLPILANGGEGLVAVELDTGAHAITIRRQDADRKKEVVESRLPQTSPRPWVVGYGVRRGNARGERDREPAIGAFGELHTLFDHPPSLHNAIRWLADRDADVLREQRKSGREGDTPNNQPAGIWKAVGHALEALLGIKNIRVESEYVIYVQHDVFGRVRLDALSDGYLTTAGWIIDMVARWIERQRELDEHVGADILRQMRGFVLIDEIDLHLHPIWQMNMIDDVRRLFPHLSFIVTTHNPLTLQGARPGEVYVMRRLNDSRIELVQKDIRPGQDVDRVLFEQFGVEHTFDKETRDLLNRHETMLRTGITRDDPTRKAIEADIGGRFGAVGATLNHERDVKLGPLQPWTDEESALLLNDLKSVDRNDT